VLADHAPRIFAGCARLGAKARCEGGEAEWQRGLINDGFAHEVCEGDFGRGDEAQSVTYLLNIGIAATCQDLATDRPKLIFFEFR
jgi:hypothetical protein